MKYERDLASISGYADSRNVESPNRWKMFRLMKRPQECRREMNLALPQSMPSSFRRRAAGHGGRTSAPSLRCWLSLTCW